MKYLLPILIISAGLNVWAFVLLRREVRLRKRAEAESQRFVRGRRARG